LQLESALESVVGNGMGTILSCIPGKAGLFWRRRWIAAPRSL